MTLIGLRLIEQCSTQLVPLEDPGENLLFPFTAILGFCSVAFSSVVNSFSTFLFFNCSFNLFALFLLLHSLKKNFYCHSIRVV